MRVGRIIDGKAFAAKLREQVATGVQTFTAQAGRKPGLAVVLVGEDPASGVYVRNKGKATVERSEEHTSELQSLMRISYAVFCLKKKKHTEQTTQSRDDTNNKHNYKHTRR